MESEMVERVARVFCVAADKDPDKPFVDRQGVTHDFAGWGGFVDNARAAIEAMREPTEAMLDIRFLAGADQLPRVFNRDVWKVMIDAALTPKDA